MKKIEMLTLKMNLLGGMYDYIAKDEDAYADWIQNFPDEPTEEDLKEIAEDASAWVGACMLFGKLVEIYELEDAMREV